jgi:hypothetical protein
MLMLDLERANNNECCNNTVLITIMKFRAGLDWTVLLCSKVVIITYFPGGGGRDGVDRDAAFACASATSPTLAILHITALIAPAC